MEREEKERFRIETARQILVALIANDKYYSSRRSAVRESIELTDALISELDPTEKANDPNHPFIKHGYAKITSYRGTAKYVVVGRIYECETNDNLDGEIYLKLRTGEKSRPYTYAYEDKSTWVESTLEEYLKQQKKLQQ